MTTLEAAMLVPLVIIFLCVFLLGTVSVLQDAGITLEALREKEKVDVRQPTAVIRNTDLVLSYLERIQDALEGES